EKTLKRKFTEWLMSVALERRLSKDKILELYLNDVYLGQRGSFNIHGVPEAARLFFGKDVSNLTLAEAATIAGVIQAPPHYSTFDLHLQRIAQDAVRDGLTKVDAILSRRKPRFPEAALIAIDPRTGEILAMVGGRSYNQSQYNRAVSARRQPGSVFKPFVYLAAFERAMADGRTDITPATVVEDEPTSFTFNNQIWTPSNYENKYDGPITLRRALAH